MNVAALCATPARRRGSILASLARLGIAAGLAAALAPAAAQEATALAPAAALVAPAPAADAARLYRGVGAQHLYDTYRQRIFKGRLPPLLYAIAIVDVDIDGDGKVVNAVVDREPAWAKEVVPWILGLIHAASPFPRPGDAAPMRYRDIWLVDRDYTFQLDTLTEGQD